MMSNTANEDEALARVKAFEFGLLKLGMSQGRNLIIDYRFGLTKPADVERGANELIALGPDAILAHTPIALAALQRATRTIPILFVQASDPVALGLVSNLAQPEANITGFVAFEPSLGGKWLQLLRDVAPDTSEVLVLQQMDNPSSAGFVRAVEQVAPKLGLKVSLTSVRNANGIDQAISGAQRRTAGLLVLPAPIFTEERERIIAAARSYGLPAIYPFRYFALEGGLISYSADNVDQWRQAASYVDRIVRGAQVRDLPIQLPTKFELVINLKTARALGLTIHRDVLLVADEVIE
jgi:putative ABC transport system substrate-binding protein